MRQEFPLIKLAKKLKGHFWLVYGIDYLFPLIKLAKKLKDKGCKNAWRRASSVFPLIKLAKKLKEVGGTIVKKSAPR